MTTEPGKAFTRLAVSMSEEDEKRLLKLRAHLEASTGQRHSMAEVVRKAVTCLCEREGVA